MIGLVLEDRWFETLCTHPDGEEGRNYWAVIKQSLSLISWEKTAEKHEVKIGVT